MLREFLRTHWREVAAAALMLLPPLLLIPLGALWLWQQGHGLWFLALGLLGAMPAGVLLLRRRRGTLHLDKAKPIEAEPLWPERERQAFAAVERLCDEVEPISLVDADQAFSVARRTVELVARHYRPDAAMPLAAFTIPEALLLSQRVSARLRRTILDIVPLSDRLTLAELIWASRTVGKVSPLLDLGRVAYDAYRSVRLVVNPAGAIMGELGKIIFDATSDKAADWLQRRLTRILVLEVGKSAIELYSGRLKSDEVELDRRGATIAREGVAAAEAPPLRVLIAGQVNAGKSSLLNALAREAHAPVSPLPGPAGFRCFEAKDPDGRVFVLVDAPGLGAAHESVSALLEEARKADIVLWAVAANQAALDIDAAGMKAFRDWFAARPDLNRPPLLCVMTHIDQLSPFSEWQPPYDIADPARPKARAIRGAAETIAKDLAIEVEAVVPVCLSPERGLYNLDALWARLAACLSAARYAQLARSHAASGKAGWWSEAGRLYRAGRTLFRNA